MSNEMQQAAARSSEESAIRETNSAWSQAVDAKDPSFDEHIRNAESQQENIAFRFASRSWPESEEE